MAKSNFGLFTHFPLIEFMNASGPVIFLKMGDRQIHVLNARRVQGKFFHTDLGVFEMDSEYENKLMGQSFYIYNLQNAKPISLKHIEKIQTLYRSNDPSKVTSSLEKISSTCKKFLKERTNVEPLKAIKEIIAETKDTFELDDIKFLVNYTTFDKNTLKIFNLTKLDQKKTELDISKRIFTIAPIAILGAVATVIIIIMKFFNPLKLFPEFHRAILNGVGNFILSSINNISLYIGGLLN